jgi:hypothetical protein
LKDFISPKNEETFGESRRLIKYCQFLEKISHSILKHPWDFSAVFKNVYLFILGFLAEPLIIFSGSLGFHGTLAGKL